MSEKQTLKFVVNTNYDNKEYGPDFPEDTAEVGDFFADHFVKTGRGHLEGQATEPDAEPDDENNGRREELKSLTVPELRELAKPFKIDTNGINKKPLIEEIIKAES